MPIVDNLWFRRGTYPLGDFGVIGKRIFRRRPILLLIPSPTAPMGMA